MNVSLNTGNDHQLQSLFRYARLPKQDIEHLPMSLADFSDTDEESGEDAENDDKFLANLCGVKNPEDPFDSQDDDLMVALAEEMHYMARARRRGLKDNRSPHSYTRAELNQPRKDETRLDTKA